MLVDDAGKACVSDFGLSKFSSGPLETAGAKIGTISGTLRFLAPEVLRGEPLTFETDVFAFGMMIYEVFAIECVSRLLTWDLQVFVGETPFIRASDDEVRRGCLELQRPTSRQVVECGFNDALWKILSDCISREPLSRPHFHRIQARLSSMTKAEPSSIRPDPGKALPWIESFLLMCSTVVEDHHVTSWVDDTEPTIGSPRTSASLTPSLGNSSSTTPLLKKRKPVSREEASLSSHRSITQNITSVRPVCVEVTLKYLGVRFGVSSREPGGYLEENGTLQWQPIKSKKRSLLRCVSDKSFDCLDSFFSRAEANRFTFQSSVGEESSSWTLEGADVILQSLLVDRAVCRFDNAEIARKWFELQLSFARNGTVGEWGKTLYFLLPSRVYSDLYRRLKRKG